MMDFDRQAAWDWLHDHDELFMRSNWDEVWFDEDAAYAALIEHLGLEDTQEVADTVAPVIMSFVECYH